MIWSAYFLLFVALFLSALPSALAERRRRRARTAEADLKQDPASASEIEALRRRVDALERDPRTVYPVKFEGEPSTPWPPPTVESNPTQSSITIVN